MTNNLIKAVKGLKYTETQVRRGDVAHEVHNEAIDKVLALIRQTLPEADRKAVGDEKPTFVLPSAYVETAKKHYGDYANIISTADTLIKPQPSGLTEKERERVVEKIAKALAINLYHSEGLETMNYRGEQDFAEREWRHYEDQAQAALTAIEQLCNLSWKEKSNG